MIEHQCILPMGWTRPFLGQKFICLACNTVWVRERYARYRVWATVRPNGRKERR